MATVERLCSYNAMVATSFFPMKTRQLRSENINVLIKARIWKKLCVNRRSFALVSSASNSDIGPNLGSLSHTIEQFYACINQKNLNQLSDFISDYCLLEDFSFPKPFEGKKEVMDFFAQLIASMGQNVEFSIGNICIGDDFVAGVTWHLEWNKIRIPFTRGCSFYEFSIEGTSLVIKKCLVMIESPMKPGGSALNLLKIVSSLFDKFPKAAERFLKSPQDLLRMIIKIYSMVLRPFLGPLLAWYINIGKFMVRLFSYILYVLGFISKIFFK